MSTNASTDGSQLLEMVTHPDPSAAMSQLLAALSLVVARMDDEAQQRAAWHLMDAALRTDPHLRLRCLH